MAIPMAMANPMVGKYLTGTDATDATSNFVDSDNDGLSDDYETSITESGARGGLLDGNADTDNDGI